MATHKSNSKAKVSEGEIRWTDDKIRWPDDKDPKDDDDEDDEEEDRPFMDPFKDPDPTDTFSFRFRNSLCDQGDSNIVIELSGYKHDSDEVWQSTGLTLWRASEHLCNYMVQHADMLQDKRILEVSKE